VAGDDVAIDTQLLVLLVTGLAAPRYIRMNKRLADYSIADFDTLSVLLQTAGRIIVTPGVLAETSNFVRHIAEPARRHVMEEFGRLIEDATEQHVPARQVARAASFGRFGFADATLLAMVGSTLLTADDPLYAEALRLGSRALNFNYLRGAGRA
jgi:hypothetical protein